MMRPLLTAVTFAVTLAAEATFDVAVDAAARPLGALPHFWYSGGYCPPCSRAGVTPSGRDCTSHTAGTGLTDYSLGDDLHQNFIHVGAIPNRGTDRWQIRVHFLFDLLTADAKGAYNFSKMDVLMGRLVANRLKPGFELMGSPEFANGSAVFTSFDAAEQVVAWRSLVGQVAKRYVAKFGAAEVRRWNWETWNEIENGDWDQTNISAAGFRNYYDACAAGLADADPSLRFGGPGNCRLNADYCFPLLAHMQNGTSFFGGPVRKADFVAQHSKGNGDGDSVHEIMQKEYEMVAALRTSFPQFFTTESKMTFINDESDPEEGWNKPRDWRADTRYGALMAKNVIHHLTAWTNSQNSSAITAGLEYGLLSFDNAFLNYNLNSSSVNVFDQRTMVARFQMNESKPYRAETVRKQSINTHALLGLLGDQQLPLRATAGGGAGGTAALRGSGAKGKKLPWAPPTTETMAIASSTNGEQLTVLVATGDAIANASAKNVTLRLSITNLLPAIVKSGAHAAIFVLGAPGASDLWQAEGAPPYPSASLLRRMRAAQELSPLRIEALPAAEAAAAAPAASAAQYVTQIETPADKAWLALVHICPDTSQPVPPPTAVAAHSVSPGSTLLSWDHVAHACVKTFVVEDASSGKRLNVQDQIFMAYQLEGALPPKLTVRAVNYAGESSAPAALLLVPQ